MGYIRKAKLAIEAFKASYGDDPTTLVVHPQDASGWNLSPMSVRKKFGLELEESMAVKRGFILACRTIGSPRYVACSDETRADSVPEHAQE